MLPAVQWASVENWSDPSATLRRLKARWILQDRVGFALEHAALDLTADYGMHATILCNSTLYNEGYAAGSTSTAQQLRVFTLVVKACNSSVCPDNARAVQPNYVERQFQVQIANPL